MKLDLLTNATAVDDAIRFVSRKSKDNVESKDSGNKDDEEEAKEQQEQEAEDVTTNCVF
jgi:hypothetical protein